LLQGDGPTQTILDLIRFTRRELNGCNMVMKLNEADKRELRHHLTDELSYPRHAQENRFGSSKWSHAVARTLQASPF
jgi:hypothetical protein